YEITRRDWSSDECSSDLKCSLVRHSGTRVIFRKGSRRGCFGLVSERGLPEGLLGGWHRVVRLEINGWDSSFRSDRLNCSERRWHSDSKWAAKIDLLDRAEAGIDRTGRKGRAMCTVGS